MGYGGYVTLVNGSPFDWTAGYQHSYQMPSWSWPTVTAGEASRVYVEWGTSGTTKDDAAEAIYGFSGSDKNFQLQARNLGIADFHIYVQLDNVETAHNAKGSRLDAGFRHDQAVNFILSQDQSGTLWSNFNPPVDWMHRSLGSIGNRTLRHICMPGSHDAGMTTFRPGTVGANYMNTQTQYLNIYDQLRYGSRYFDLRPVIASGEFAAGHYSMVESVWLGGNGQTMADIIDQINKFTDQYHELIILNLSHVLDTDNGYGEFTQDQWNRLFEQLKGIKARYIVSSDPGDLTKLKLNDFIGSDRATVLIIAQLTQGATLGSYLSQGFFQGSNFPVYDSYSNSNDATTMENDQLSKLSSNRNIAAGKDGFHLLSWTLTQQIEDILNPDRAILNLATLVYDSLYWKAYSAFTPDSFPNVLYVDALGVRDKSVTLGDKPNTVSVFPDIYALAMAVNNGVAARNSKVTG